MVTAARPFAAIPEPGTTQESHRQAIQALKETIETLTFQKTKSGDAAAVLRGDLTSILADITALQNRGEVWFQNAAQTRFEGVGLVNVSNVVDQQGTIDIDSLYPGLVPDNATSVILTCEVGYITTPASSFSCQLRVMADGFNLSNVWDLLKLQHVYVLGGGIDVPCCQLQVPVRPGAHKFFYALQSVDPAVANKMIILELRGYVT